MPDIKTAENIANSEAVFGILFILLLIIVWKGARDYVRDMKTENEKREEEITNLYKDHKEESKEREERLMNHLDKQSDTLERIDKNLHSLSNRVDEGFRDVWTHIKRER